MVSAAIAVSATACLLTLDQRSLEVAMAGLSVHGNGVALGAMHSSGR